MRLGVQVDGDRASVVDLATGEPVENVVRASVRVAEEGVVASMTWAVVGSRGTPDVAAAPVVLGREAFLGPQPAPGADRGDDDDRPRPRRAL